MAAISTILAAAGTAIAAGTAVDQHNQQKKGIANQLARQAAEDAARAKAESEAAQASSSALAAKNRVRKASSLLARDQPDTLAGTGGKTMLGQ